MGGALLRLDRFDPAMLDTAQARRISESNDDIWLYFMARLAGTRFRHTGWTDPLVTWAGSQGSALWRTSVAERGNDGIMAAMVAEYGWERASRKEPPPRVLAA